MRRTLLIGSGLLVAVGMMGCKSKSSSAWKLPVDAKQLPGTTSQVAGEIIEGTTESDPKAQQMFTAAELGSEICRTHSSNPARDLERMNKNGPESAKEFFTPTHLAEVQAIMDCGAQLQQNLTGNFVTLVQFQDDSGSKQGTAVLQLKSTELQTKYGFTKHAFAGLNGFCRTTDVSKPNAPTTDCSATTDAAIVQGTTWFFGSRGALETVAKTLNTPKSDLTTQVAALNDAAAAIEGLPQNEMSANLTTTKPFIEAACAFGAEQTAGSITEFLSGCFPSTEEKTIQAIDSKVRAAAFEIDPDYQKSGVIHSNIVFIARDDDAAKEVEKDATDLMTDWKSQLENNEDKLIKQSKTDTSSRREKRWAVVSGTFLHALEKGKVSRSGRSVKIAFNEPLAADDKKDLADANAKSAERHQAIAELLEAVQQKKPIPANDVTKIVGATWAPYLVQMSTFDATKMPTDCAKKIAASKKKGAPPLDAACVVPTEPPLNDFGTHPKNPTVK